MIVSSEGIWQLWNDNTTFCPRMGAMAPGLRGARAWSNLWPDRERAEPLWAAGRTARGRGASVSAYKLKTPSRSRNRGGRRSGSVINYEKINSDQWDQPSRTIN